MRQRQKSANEGTRYFTAAFALAQASVAAGTHAQVFKVLNKAHQTPS